MYDLEMIPGFDRAFRNGWSVQFLGSNDALFFIGLEIPLPRVSYFEVPFYYRLQISSLNK